MNQIKKLELVGFKSFCDRTHIPFNEGITAIVGPNGCGKSNISDAVSWVVGEQSAKSLRTDKMEGVIFNGTQARKPTGFAEVILTLSLDNAVNLPDIPDLNPQNFSVGRRLYRSGESEYYLDGRRCRLKDIQALFEGTGLGPNSYAILEQGRIGQILSSKPAERRALIEEAARITLFKSRRYSAEMKLEQAQQWADVKATATLDLQEAAQDALATGDLCFLANNPAQQNKIGHVGIYIGGDLIVEAKGKDYGIVISTVQEWQRKSTFAGWRRPKI